MGTWWQTCAISNLPILPGEGVRMFILYGNQVRPAFAGMTYANDLFQPYQLPIKAVVDDYGMIRDLQNEWVLRLTVANLRESLISEEHKVLVEGDPLGALLNLMIELYGDEPVKINVQGSVRSLGMCFIREDIYNTLANTTYWSFGTETLEKDSVKAEEREVITVAAVQKTQLLTAKNLRDEMVAAGVNPSLQATITKVTQVLQASQNISAALAANTSDDPAWAQARGILSDLLAAKLNREKFDQILDELVEYRMVGTHMGGLRKFWSPQAGSGSQAENWDTHAQLAQAILRVCEHKLTDEAS